MRKNWEDLHVLLMINAMLVSLISSNALIIVININIIGIIIIKNIDNKYFIFKKFDSSKNNQDASTDCGLNLMLFLPSECQEHFKDETKNILKKNKKYIAYYKIIKLYFWEMLLIRIMNDCYLRAKNVIFRSFIK